jgi:hypothetical protein
MRSARGQAAVDYVALLALVFVVLGGLGAAVEAPWLAPRLADTIRRGICIVSGALCSPQEAARAGLAPCPVHRRTDAERLGGTVAVLRLERGDALVLEQRSDGTAGVSFVDGWKAGGEVGLGAQLPVLGAGARAGAGVAFQSGRRYDFGSWAAAGRFVARVARTETLTGEARERLRALCPVCRGRRGRLPDPAATFREGGAYADLVAEGDLPLRVRGRSVPLDAELAASHVAVLGRRVEGPRTTWYVRLEAGATAQLGALLGSVSSGRDAEGVLEITSQGGRRVEARVRASGALAGEGELLGASLSLAEVADRLGAGARRARAEGAPGGFAAEATVALDLTDPANARAVDDLLAPGLSPMGWGERLGALGRRLDVAGAVDLAVFRTAQDGEEHEVAVRPGVELAGGYERSSRTRELVAAWSQRAGGALRRREDCEDTAARRAAAS